MSYPAGSRAEFSLILHNIKSTFDFNGRARRSELLYYQIAVALLGIVIGFGSMAILSLQQRVLLLRLMQIVTAIPLFALFARRLHDQDRSGWWALPLPVIIAFNMTDNYHRWTNDGQIPSLPLPLTIIRSLAIIAMLVFTFWRGTQGPNHFGKDPRPA
ncbi:MAG: DUF805 domain-containing protein [Pseudomonadota bacterium]|jgi:uncharacterized membrane protein YhaH (DUF805 family)|uniref:DUF805 domain-containing protein n=1 Tax=Sphingobium yanoikuyae TaxID=13690 RepID=UPI001376AD54|nr:DUF805 domain-containing protein [Sphingobium yanoikuyae]NBB42344.1 DUF805 domain-containing protein [Sphingobium yanoikuyae]